MACRNRDAILGAKANRILTVALLYMRRRIQLIDKAYANMDEANNQSAGWMGSRFSFSLCTLEVGIWGECTHGKPCAASRQDTTLWNSGALRFDRAKGAQVLAGCRGVSQCEMMFSGQERGTHCLGNRASGIRIVIVGAGTGVAIAKRGQWENAAERNLADSRFYAGRFERENV